MRACVAWRLAWMRQAGAASRQRRRCAISPARQRQANFAHDFALDPPRLTLTLAPVGTLSRSGCPSFPASLHQQGQGRADNVERLALPAGMNIPPDASHARTAIAAFAPRRMA
jgi:hypothetical protein